MKRPPKYCQCRPRLAGPKQYSKKKKGTRSRMSMEVAEPTNHSDGIITTESMASAITSDVAYAPEKYHTADAHQYIFQKHISRICKILNIDENNQESIAFGYVKEQLGVVSHLVHLWNQLYMQPGPARSQNTATVLRTCNIGRSKSSTPRMHDLSGTTDRQKKGQVWKGFVDIGCGNGVIVDVLNKEGWSGWGFDARSQTSWEKYDKETQALIERMELKPIGRDIRTSFIHAHTNPKSNDVNDDDSKEDQGLRTSMGDHNGIFEKGIWMISKHGDEITPWIPVLSMLSDCSFLAVPCCPYDLDGKEIYSLAPANFLLARRRLDKKSKEMKHIMYIEYVESLCNKLGIRVRREYLRIPSARNIALVRAFTEDDKFEVEGVGECIKREEDRYQEMKWKMDVIHRVTSRET